MASEALDSICLALVGSRGSGKTLLMTYLAILMMAYYRLKVWSNYIINCDYVFASGEVVHCESIPLDMNSLYCFDKGIADGIVCIDEVNLWGNSRTSMATTNRLLNDILTLIRHRQLSFYFTTQSESWIDSRIRFQLDILGRCQDLHHRYPAYKKGTHIQIGFQDMSGLTGFPFYETGQIYFNTLDHAEAYWGCYDTKQEFDVLSIYSNKIEIAKTRRIIADENDPSFLKQVEDPQSDMDEKFSRAFNRPITR